MASGHDSRPDSSAEALDGVLSHLTNGYRAADTGTAGPRRQLAERVSPSPVGISARLETVGSMTTIGCGWIAWDIEQDMAA